MKKLTTLLLCLPCMLLTAQVHTTYLWHMDQPVYWGDHSQKDPEKKQFVKESHDLKSSGKNRYEGSSVSHPTNDLQDIFSKDDRVNAYQTAPRNAINSIRNLNNEAGAQLSISGGLMDNLKSLGDASQWGYRSNWMASYAEAIGWKTAGGFARLDVVGFTYDHALSPLVSERALKKQIQAHQYSAQKYYGHVSKGYWPAECAFSERIIKTLRECGIEWSIVANSHLARTLSDYTHPYNINGNIDAPNPADQVETTGNNWFDGAIDGRGSRLAAPYCYQAHKAKYTDPETGTDYIIDVVPMCNYMSYIDGYSGANVSDVKSKIAPYDNATQPSILLLAHDGDNAWGGGSSYYNEAVPGFSGSAKNAGYVPTTIQQFLTNHPVPATDIVKVEDGAWVNADSDWGHPQFINWLWPLYNKTTHRFDPSGWTEDARNWAVITATENYVCTAEDLTGGTLNIAHITDGGGSANDAEKAWHFFFGGLNSGFMYYGKAEDMEVKPSMTGNIAIDYAQRVIAAHPGTDKTPPSVFVPQRYPYNPGAYTFGPTASYKKTPTSQDFDVWTLAYDINGLSSVTLKYRVDKDGKNPLIDNDNDTYKGGAGVEEWQSTDMTIREFAADPTNDKELDFFILPKAKAKLCYAEIKGSLHSGKLLDYYVEATDSKGNVAKSAIQHVFIGTDNGGGGDIDDPRLSVTPTNPTTQDVITITCTDAALNQSSRFHWGVNGWTAPIEEYRPTGSTLHTDKKAVQTPFKQTDGKWQLQIGPFNNSKQEIKSINFVLKLTDTNWDNNGGQDYQITVSTLTALEDNTDNGDKPVAYKQGDELIVLLPQPQDQYRITITDLWGRIIDQQQITGRWSKPFSTLPHELLIIRTYHLSTGTSDQIKWMNR